MRKTYENRSIWPSRRSKSKHMKISQNVHVYPDCCQKISTSQKVVFWANTRNKTDHTMWKDMENCARKWCLLLCTILFQATWAFWKMWFTMYLIPISMIGRELIMVLVMELLVNVGICQYRPALGKLTFTINDLFNSYWCCIALKLVDWFLKKHFLSLNILFQWAWFTCK